jgi:hypothetical protein
MRKRAAVNAAASKGKRVKDNLEGMGFIDDGLAEPLIAEIE